MEGANEDPLRRKEVIQALEDFLQQVTNSTIEFSKRLQACCSNCSELKKAENADLEDTDDDDEEKVPCEDCIIQNVIYGLLTVSHTIEENIKLKTGF
jgi:hypothetical protein